MSITKTTHALSLQINPRFIRTEKDASTSIIIIDDVNISNVIEVHTEVAREITWLKIASGFIVSVIDDAPPGVTAFNPDHDHWNKTRILAAESEVLVVKYTSATKTTPDEITGYVFDHPSDALYIKINQQANTITVYA
jgi:hypothetical protein